jgi:hypothetical protein
VVFLLLLRQRLCVPVVRLCFMRLVLLLVLLLLVVLLSLRLL